jgi:hypothetical protein
VLGNAAALLASRSSIKGAVAAMRADCAAYDLARDEEEAAGVQALQMLSGGDGCDAPSCSGGGSDSDADNDPLSLFRRGRSLSLAPVRSERAERALLNAAALKEEMPGAARRTSTGSAPSSRRARSSGSTLVGAVCCAACVLVRASMLIRRAHTRMVTSV